jgi:hypothetical protein
MKSQKGAKYIAWFNRDSNEDDLDLFSSFQHNFPRERMRLVLDVGLCENYR